MAELELCAGQGDTESCHKDNQPCKCLRDSWEYREFRCVCWTLNDSNEKVWLCGCKGCEAIEEDGQWTNKVSDNLAKTFVPTASKPTPVTNDGWCPCTHSAYNHFCGTCINCKNSCNIYGE